MKSKKGVILGMFAASLAILGISGFILGKSMTVKGSGIKPEIPEPKKEVFTIEQFEKESQEGNNVFINLKLTAELEDSVECKCMYRLVYENGKFYTEYVSGENVDKPFVENVSSEEKYDYLLDVTGRLPCAESDSRYIVLSNTVYDFEAIGKSIYSNNTDDKLEDAKFLWIDEILYEK